MTTLGIRLAIQHLPNLKFLKCEDSVKALSEILRDGLASHPAHDDSSSQQPNSVNRRFSLMDLCCTTRDPDSLSPYLKGSLAHAVQLCPLVVHVEIDLSLNADLKDVDLQALLNLKNLRHFTLAFINVSFDGGILPILEKFGRDSLEILELCYLNEVDVAAIVRHCANLQSLTLKEIYQCNGSPHRQPSANAVYHLRHLKLLRFIRLECGQSGEPTSATLSLLLRSCPALVKLKLHSLDRLTDQVIREAAIAHGFKKLEDLYLSDCQRISRSSIDLLLFTLSCPFRRVKLNYCFQLNMKKDYVSAWKTKAEENNWNLSMYRASDDEESSDED